MENTRLFATQKIMNTAFVLMAILSCTGILVGCSSASGEEESLAPPAKVEVVNVESRTVETQRRFSGYSHPWESHGIGFLVAGRVTSMRVSEGELVTKGQLLATIDPEDYQLVEQLASTQVKALEPNYHRVNSLVQKDALPQSNLDEIEGKYEAAVTQRNQARRQVHYTRLVAPISGIVHELRTSVGQVIGPGKPAVVLLDLSRIKIKFGITQRDLPLFKPGQDVDLEIQGIDRKFTGKVAFIDLVADDYTRTYNANIEVPNPENLLRPSMLAHLFVNDRRKEGFFLPIHCISHDQAGKPIVKIVDPSTLIVEERPVEVGERHEETLQILSGLKKGESVIVRGTNYVRQGDKVVLP